MLNTNTNKNKKIKSKLTKFKKTKNLLKKPINGGKPATDKKSIDA